MSNIRVVMTLLVRDEASVLRSNLEFHLGHGVDFFVATDNRSVDGATDILLDYQRQGVLRYIHEPADNYAQSIWVTRMARLACNEHGANWVINSDVDEFWYPDAGDLKACLAAVPTTFDAAAVERYNFLPRPMARGDRFYDAMTLRETISRNVQGELLPPKICHRAFPDIEVAMGNHAVSRDGTPMPYAKSGISLLHFPLRTFPEFADKIAKGGAALERNSTLGLGIAYTWRTYYQMLGEGRLEQHFQHMMMDDEAIARGIAAGEVTLDTRLRDAMAARKGSEEIQC